MIRVVRASPTLRDRIVCFWFCLFMRLCLVCLVPCRFHCTDFSMSKRSLSADVPAAASSSSVEVPAKRVRQRRDLDQELRTCLQANSVPLRLVIRAGESQYDLDAALAEDDSLLLQEVSSEEEPWSSLERFLLHAVGALAPVAVMWEGVETPLADALVAAHAILAAPTQRANSAPASIAAASMASIVHDADDSDTDVIVALSRTTSPPTVRPSFPSFEAATCKAVNAMFNHLDPRLFDIPSREQKNRLISSGCVLKYWRKLMDKHLAPLYAQIKDLPSFDRGFLDLYETPPDLPKVPATRIRTLLLGFLDALAQPRMVI